MNWFSRSTARQASARESIFISAADTYENVDLRRGSFNDTGDRVYIHPSHISQGKRTAVLLIFGQSNGANSGSTPYTPVHRVLNFNIFDGNCYVAKDPLLGATERAGNFASRLGDMLIEQGWFDTVVLAPISVGGSRIEEWTTGGVRHRRLQVAIERTRELGLSLTHLLWHQGETNAGHGPNGELYANCFMNIHGAIRRYGVGAPMYVAQATVCRSPPNEIIRSAQRSVVNSTLGIYPGPDTDQIGPELRFDGCHMNEAGLTKHATLWFQTITQVRI